MVVGAIKLAIGDGVLTFMWVFVSSMLGIVSVAITKALDIQHINYNGFPYPSFLVTTTLVFLLVFLFTLIGNAMGGASFNPTGTAAFYSVGLGSDSLLSMALRFPAQALGAAGGAMAISELINPKYKHMIRGPSLKVDVHTGAIAELVLTFTITFAVLLIFLKGPRSDLMKTWLLAMSTVTLVMVGSTYTGPSMNPANVDDVGKREKVGVLRHAIRLNPKEIIVEESELKEIFKGILQYKLPEEGGKPEVQHTRSRESKASTYRVQQLGQLRCT